jgi:hypothetical protein
MIATETSDHRITRSFWRINVPVFKGRRSSQEAAGYEYPGIIVSVFTTRAGAARYVVEADHPGFVGMLRIFNGDPLEPRA